jgi:Peptidase family M23
VKKTVFCILFLAGFYESQCQSTTEYFMLPFPIGKTYGVSQGNYDDPQGAKNQTHIYTPNSVPPHTVMMYAYDFLLPWGSEVVAPAPCTVVHVMDDTKYGFGNLVVVAYDDGTFGKFCHMANQMQNGVDYLTRVTVGQKLSRGQLIGFSGNTGNSTGPHLHYQRQVNDLPDGPTAQSIKSTFVEVRENGGRPIQGHKYTSFNYFSTNMFYVGAFLDGWKTATLGAYSPSSDPFAICYDYSGGFNVLGALQSEVHLYPRDVSAINLCWCQDFLYIAASGAQSNYMMILNPYQTNADIGFKGVCYIIGGQIRSYWMQNYSHLGPPSTSEYYWTGAGFAGVSTQYSVQYFQPTSTTQIGVMYANGQFQEVSPSNACYSSSNIFGGTGQLFCMANCPTGGGDDYYGEEEDSISASSPDTGKTVIPNPPDTSHPVTPTSYPFQYGFTPVQKTIGEFDGLVICLDTASAADTGAESYHKLAVDTGNVFKYGTDILYFAMYRHTHGKFRLMSSTGGTLNWNNFTTASWDSTGASTWDYCPQITREQKPPIGSYQISCYLDDGSGSVLMETRSYQVVSGATASNSVFRRAENGDCIYWQSGKLVLSLGSAKNVSLHIYDLAGRERKSISGFYSAGLYRQGAILSPGIYILKFNGVFSKFRMM